MDNVFQWIQHNVVVVISMGGVLSGFLFGAYKLARKTDDKIKKIDENEVALDGQAEKDRKHDELIMKHDEQIQQINERLEKGNDKFDMLETETKRIASEVKDSNIYLKSMDMKLGVIVGFLANEPQAVEEVKVINESYKKKRHDELKK